MKKTKKIFLAVLTLALLIFPMTAFATTADEDADYYSGYSSAEEQTTQKVTADMYNESIVQWLETNYYEKDEKELKYYEKNASGSTAEAYEAFLKVYPNLGKYKKTDQSKIKSNYDEDEKMFQVVVTSEFEDGELEATVEISTFSSGVMPTKVEFSLAEKNTSMGGKLAKAALNTVMGMGTVFIVLIFISFLISQFTHLSKLGGKKEEKKETLPVAEPEPEETDLADDEELVAVIAAAIAASEQTSTDGFVVRSIRKRR